MRTKKSSATELLQLKQVSKTYQLDGVQIKALEEINLSIHPGEFISIIGPSGSGKSTLMHLAGCLDTPTAGEVFLEGVAVSQFNEERLAAIRNKKIGFIFQSYNLIPRTSALENVMLPLIYSGLNENQRKQLAKEMLIRLGLGDRLYHHPNQLSGGEQQRVTIARALINHPLLILADEPTGNVDSRTGQQIMEIFKNLNRQGNTIIIVTHDPVIARIGKRIIEIKDGRIIHDT